MKVDVTTKWSRKGDHTQFWVDALLSRRGKEVKAMFVNCYDGYGLCLFSVPVREDREAEKLGDHIYYEHDLVDYWDVADTPEGAVVRY